MRKSDLIDALSGATGETKSAVNAVLEALPDVVLSGLKEHGTVTLPGLAKIDAKTREARTVRNPATGASMEKPATVVAAFKPVKAFKDQVGGFEAG